MKYWIPFFFMTTSIAYAGLVPDGAKFFEIQDYSGGLNTSVPAHKLDPRFSPNMRNVFVHRNPGAITPSNGTLLVGSTSSLTNGRYMFTFNKEDGTTEFIVSDSSQVFSTKDFLTYTFISSGLNTTVNLECTQARNKVWCTNGSDPVFTWDTNGIKTILDGTNGTPDVPRFRYIATYQERVFGLNTSGNSASLDFSDVVSTNGIAIAPDNYLAWPATNRLNVGQGDGEIGTALWIYKGQLQIGKERSIYSLFGNNLSSYVPRKMVTNIGVESQDSVVVQDGMTYFKNKYGIYQWAGGEPERISDAIKPDMDSAIGFNSRIIQSIWDLRSDFITGQFFNSTATIGGTVDVVQSVHAGFAQDYTPDFTPYTELQEGGTTVYFQVPVSTYPVDYNFNGYVSSYTFTYRKASDVPSSNCVVAFKFINERTGEESVEGNQSCSNLNYTGTQVFPLTQTQGVGFTGEDFSLGRIKFKARVVTGHVRFVNFPYSTLFFVSTPVASYISDVATITANTAWSTFDSIYNSNEGSINYFVRTSSTVNGISTQTWSPIYPGTQLNAPTINHYVQWSASFTTQDQSNFPPVPTIDEVEINHIEGSGDIYRPFAVNWNNEYWLTVSTQTTVSSNLTYVKSWITNSNPNAWNLLDGMNIASFAKDGTNTLYGGSSSTGAFYRLDYGTNYDGKPIVRYYDTPDLDFGDTFKEKFIQVLLVNAEKESGSTLSVGVSTNSGSSFTTNASVSLDGNGELYKPLFGYSTLKGNQYRVRLSNAELDRGFTFYNLGFVYMPKEVWRNTGQ